MGYLPLEISGIYVSINKEVETSLVLTWGHAHIGVCKFAQFIAYTL